MEKREIIRFEELPRHLIDALLTREDRHFYRHPGFRVPDILRATWTTLRGGFGGGASTITQQLAGSLFADRSEITLRRKLVELWYAIQLERWLTKDEILERYLNLVYFGEGTYGIEAAAQFYTGHSARDITVAEASMLVVQLNRPGGNSPFTYPNRARELQTNNLQQMVELGYVTQAEADRSLVRYWDDFDFTRSNVSSAFYERVDRARHFRHFSEYVRLRLEELLLGKVDLYRDGLTVYTTLDLDQQAIANAVMEQHLNRVNDLRNLQRGTRIAVAEDEFLPVVDLMSLAFDIDRMRIGNQADRMAGRQRFEDELSPALDLLSAIWDTGQLKALTRRVREEQALRQRRVEVQGALVSIEPSSGHILSMVGGRDLARGNQFNRAVQSKVQPGSAFKPLYYSAAISSGAVTPATMLMDAPVVFYNPDGTPLHPAELPGRMAGARADANGAEALDEHSIPSRAEHRRLRCRDRPCQPAARDYRSGRSRASVPAHVPARARRGHGDAAADGASLCDLRQPGTRRGTDRDPVRQGPGRKRRAGGRKGTARSPAGSGGPAEDHGSGPPPT